MFLFLQIPVLGIIQNMSVYECPNCGHKEHIFGHDGALPLAAELNIDILGDVPLHVDIRKLSDSGSPIVVALPESLHTKTLREIARKVVDKLPLYVDPVAASVR